MSDLTLAAEKLITTVARAFYEDDAIFLIDVLVRDKFLRDDDMAPRLSLPAKQLRKTLQFLQNENLVKFEAVDDLKEGGAQNTRFWYIDYNHAVHTLRLRIFLLRQQLQQDEMSARKDSFYLCPGYSKKKCNGRYTEEQAQQVVDPDTGMFLCQECVRANEANPNPPKLETYVLQLVDNSKDLKSAMDNLRQLDVQLSDKMIGDDLLRPSIYNLLQMVRQKNKAVTSNLPSENIHHEVGSKRIEGTGRTAAVRAKKLAQQGIVGKQQAGSKLNGGQGGNGQGLRRNEEWLHFVNAMGQELALTVEKGGGARANILATNRRRQRKLLDTAASRLGVQVPIYWTLKQKRKREAEEKKKAKKQKANGKGKETLAFLNDNIGRKNDNISDDSDDEHKRTEEDQDDDDDDSFLDLENEKYGICLDNDTDEWLSKTEEERKTIFQAQYKFEVERQIAMLLKSEDQNNIMNHANGSSTGTGVVAATTYANGVTQPSLVTDTEEDYNDVQWEEG